MEEQQSADVIASNEYAVEIPRTDKGFGIYFARRSIEALGNVLTVDGFVEEGDEDGSAPPAEGLKLLQLGDVLTSLNGDNCTDLEVHAVVELLRSAPMGMNSFVFKRLVEESGEETKYDGNAEETIKKDSGASVATSFMGALRKVKSRIRAEIEGDEEMAKREQEETKRFEELWLTEFDRFKAAYDLKWSSCTYTADAFCGHIYHSCGAQQRARLEEKYPTLMDSWKEPQSAPNALQQWAPVKQETAATVHYVTMLEPSSHRTEPEIEPGRNVVRDIECASSIREALEFLRKEHMWRLHHVEALSQRFEELGIYSCSELLQEMECGSRSSLFERKVQLSTFPRLTKSICHALREHMDEAAKTEVEVAQDSIHLVIGKVA